MATLFMSGQEFTKTSAQKKITSIAYRANTAKRKSQKSGPVTVIRYNVQKEVK